MKIDDVKTWKNHRGKKELLKHLAGGPLTMKQTVIAECYLCTAGYFDGRVDCEDFICPLYGHMPYRKNKKAIKRDRSEKQKAATLTMTKTRGESTKKMPLQML